MPRIEVLSEALGHEHEVMLTEHVPSEMIANEHYADQLVERLGWALVDAEQHEHLFAPRHLMRVSRLAAARQRKHRDRV
jgi:hypothetical protein